MKFTKGYIEYLKLVVVDAIEGYGGMMPLHTYKVYMHKMLGMKSRSAMNFARWLEEEGLVRVLEQERVIGLKWKMDLSDGIRPKRRSKK